MRFRCKMIDTLVMQNFSNIVNAVSKMSKVCTLQLTPEEICFIVLDDRMPVVWAQLTRDHFFNEYTMAGIAKYSQDLIYLELDTLMLTKSLTSVKSAKSVKIKLLNKQGPILTVEIELPSVTDDCWQCIHEVPVKLISRKDWASYQAPEIPIFNITIDLPQLKYIKNVVERMKNMSPHLTVAAKNNGQFILKVETTSASVATHFSDLQVWKQDEEDREEVTATVDIRRFLNIHTLDAVHPDSVRCNILDDKMVYLHLNSDDNFQIQYFIPAVSI